MKKPITLLVLLLALLVSFNAYSSPKLNSLPGATATIFLDFDGYYVNSPIWNGGNAFSCAASVMTDAQVTEVFNRVSEDYRPFNINITTDSTVFLAAPLTKRTRVVVTPTSAWYPGVGGVSYVGAFTWGDDTPCFVFCDRLGPNSPKMVAECCSHESGHSIGLSHQSKYDANCNLTAAYNDGIGTGENAWAPIMGNSYYRNMSGWNNGPTPYGCSNVQDNLSIITSQNGFTYRADDYNDDINNNPKVVNATNINVDGIITTNTDKDAFTFSISQNSNLHLAAVPFSIGNNEGANLDIKVSVFNESKTLIRTYDPPASMSVSFDTILSPGTYYILLDGTGNSNASDYGSLGSYSLRGGVAGTLPIQQTLLKGIVDKNKHKLNWDIISDEPVRTIVIESSVDGIHFNTLNSVDAAANSFMYTPFQRSDLYYRIKVISIMNQFLYSNTVMLKAINKTEQPFAVSTSVHNDITINAAGNFQYLLSDANGKTIIAGTGIAGFNKINIDRQASGMYILQLVSKNEKQTERIIKQ